MRETTEKAEANVTTIKAAPPVETPAGLVVALPPCEEAVVLCEQAICPTHRWPLPDVFALAVPCPTCDGKGIRLDPSHVARAFFAVVDHGKGAGIKHLTCRECDDGWVHHADYRVLEVLHKIRRTNLYPEYADAFSLLGDRTHLVIDHSDLPGAVPGGVALIVERVSAD